MVAARNIEPKEELTFVYVSVLRLDRRCWRHFRLHFGCMSQAPDAVLLVQYGMAPRDPNVHNMAGEHALCPRPRFLGDLLRKWPGA